MAGNGKWGAAMLGLLGLPGEYGSGGSTVTFEEGWSVTVCPCEALLAYSGEAVTLETKRGTLTIAGKDLTLKSFHGDVMEVRGSVTDIRYREKNAGNDRLGTSEI